MSDSFNFEYSCNKCGKDKVERVGFICSCGGEFKLKGGLNNYGDPFKPYVLENGVPEPVLIESRKQRDALFKERHIDQKRDPNRKYSPYSRIFPVSGSCSKGSGTKWGGNRGLEY